MKFKVRLILVITVLVLAAVYSIKRRFFRRRTVILDKYLADNKNRNEIPNDDFDAMFLDSYDNGGTVNCDPPSLTWTGPFISSSSGRPLLEPRCEDFADVTSVLYIYSNATNREERALIRETYGHKDTRQKYKFLLIFVVGSHADRSRRDFERIVIQREHLVYKDMLQIDYSDSLENDAVKGILALKWIIRCATSVINIIKVNEKTVPNIPLLFNDLNSRTAKEAHKELFCGLETGHIIEDKDNMKADNYNNERLPIKVYPSYCHGYVIVFSKYIVKQLLKAAEDRPIFKMADVYLTGYLRDLVCLPVPRRRMRFPKVVANRPYNIGAFHFIQFRQFNQYAFKSTWQSTLVFEKLVGL